MATVFDNARDRLGRAVFARVAGEDADAAQARIHDAEGPRWFDESSAIRQVHADASMFIGGLRALLLQSLHPLAMAGVAGHSGYRGDPWGRLQRTSTFLATTTFGLAEDAEAAVATVRRIHARVKGVTDDGVPYAASDPHLLRWVHVTEVDSFLTAYQRYGAAPLDQAGRDRYVAEVAVVSRALGATDLPTTTAELAESLAAYRPELRGTREARQAARFMLLHPPLPLALRPAYGVLAAAAVSTLPRWTRWPLRLPYLPVTEATAGRAAGMFATTTIRWALAPTAARPAQGLSQR